MNRLKTFTILSILVFILASIFIYPNFNSKLPTWWKYAFPDNRLNLGLDLKGGISIMLGVDDEKVMPIIYNQEQTSIREDLISNKILIRDTNVSSEGIKIFFYDKKSLIDAKKILRVDSIEESAENLFLLKKIDDKKLIDKKILLLRQVKDILNNRIDQFGVVESSIQLASNDRILVQIPGVGESQRSRILNIISKTALPTDIANGFPPNVLPCVPGFIPSDAFLFTKQAPRGKPPPIPFAIGTISGFIFA